MKLHYCKYISLQFNFSLKYNFFLELSKNTNKNIPQLRVVFGAFFQSVKCKVLPNPELTGFK